MRCNAARLLLLIAIPFTLANCAAKQAVKLGDIPSPAPIQADKVQETHFMVQSNFEKQGLTLRQTGADYKRVQNILLRLEAAAGVSGFNYPLFIADGDETVNAMAVNGNTIVVYAELIRRVKDDAVLATVLSHEVAHILAKHHEDDSSEQRAESLSVGSSILGTLASIGAAVAGAGRLGADLARDTVKASTQIVGTGALVRAYDRRLETEADEIGMMLMAKAGYHPHAAVEFWQNSAQIIGETSHSEFFSTHPSGDSRQETLQSALAVSLPYYETAQRSPLAANRLYPSQTSAAFQAQATAALQKSNVSLGSNVHVGKNTNLSAPTGDVAMLKQITALYVKRGVPPAQAIQTVETIYANMAQLAPAQRRQALESMIQTMSAN